MRISDSLIQTGVNDTRCGQCFFRFSLWTLRRRRCVGSLELVRSIAVQQPCHDGTIVAGLFRWQD